MQAIEIAVEIDANSEIHIKLPEPRRPGPARVILLLETEQEPLANQCPRHQPSPRLAGQGAKLHGDDMAPALTIDEWGEIYR